MAARTATGRWSRPCPSTTWNAHRPTACRWTMPACCSCWPWTSNSTRRAWRSGWTAAAGSARHGRRRRRGLLPAVEVRAEGLALLAHDAEAVPGGRFHHPPAFDEGDLARTEALEAVGLGIDVVGLDVQVHARLVRDLLQQDHRLVVGGGQHRVAAVAVLVGRGDRLAQGGAPEGGGRAEVIDLAIQDQGHESAVVGHGGTPAGWKPDDTPAARPRHSRLPGSPPGPAARRRGTISWAGPCRPAARAGSARPRRRWRRGGRRSARSAGGGAPRSRPSPRPRHATAGRHRRWPRTAAPPPGWRSGRRTCRSWTARSCSRTARWRRCCAPRPARAGG